MRFLLLIFCFIPNITLAENKCFGSKADAYNYLVQGDTNTKEELEFKTGDFLNVQGKVIIIKQNKAYHSGSVLTITKVTSDFNKGYIKSNIKVFENRIIDSSHCTSKTIRDI